MKITTAQTSYCNHVAHCKRCKIKGGKGETIIHCAAGELLEIAAVFSVIGRKRRNDPAHAPEPRQ